MELTKTEHLLSDETRFSDSGPQEPCTLKAFFIFKAGNELSEKMVASLRHMGTINLVKLASSHRDISDFIKEFEPVTMAFERHHLNAGGLETLLPIVSRKGIPVVFQLTETHQETGYLCIGMEFSCPKGDYYGRLFPTVKTLVQRAWQ